MSHPINFFQGTAAICSLHLLIACVAQPIAVGPESISVLVAKARSLAPTVGESIWPGFAGGPFRILVVDGDAERLYCADTSVPDSFKSTVSDALTGCSVHERPRQFNPSLLASFPLEDGVPTIVIGTPKITGKSDEDWIITVLHEHFHQLQYAWPDYHARVMALDLHGGDQTGMWMLNYPFPYDDEATARAVSELATAAADSLESIGTDDFAEALSRYRAARENFITSLSEPDRRYFDFQAWQEGTARYIELSASAAWDAHAATNQSVTKELILELRSLDLDSDKRVAFYSLGAAAAYLLDEVERNWKQRYFDERMALEIGNR